MLFLLLLLAAQERPFTPTAQIGKPFVVGEDPQNFGGGIQPDYGKKFELTVDSAEVALTFANHRETLLAKAGQKLVIFRCTVRNPSEKAEAHLTSGAAFAVRVWKRFEGPGEFRYLLAYDAQTLQGLDLKLPPGGTGRLVEVIEVPAAYTAMQLGLYFANRNRIAWYDLRAIDNLKPGAELDGLAWRVTGVSHNAEGLTVDLAVTNPLLLPARFGWQYFPAELATGVKYYPDLTDLATGKSWTGEIAAGATIGVRYLFPKASAGASMRLTSAATGRTLDLAVTR